MTLDHPGQGETAPQEPRRRPKSGLALYSSLLAERTRGMRSSAMRDMFALTERPEVISLAGGLPDTSTFSPALYARLMAEVAEHSVAKALQYGPTEGMRAVAECAVEVMAEEGSAVDPDHLLITTGGQQVLDLVCKTLLDPGDVVLAEGPTYPGAIPAFAAFQAEVHQVEVDREGLVVEAVAEAIRSLRKAGRRVKLIYTIPNFQNPAGVTLSASRREALLALAKEQEVLILEDNPYGLLRYEGEPLPTIHSLDQGGGEAESVIYLGTFSKIFAPGVRVGWVVAPAPIREKLNLAKQGADLCSSPLCQLFVTAFFRAQEGERPAWRSYLEGQCALYSRRRDVMVSAIERELGEVATFHKPQGGLFLWVTLDGKIDTTDLLARCELVAFVPGRAAYCDNRRGASAMRLNFAGSPEPQIEEGIRRIAEAVRGEQGLLGALQRPPGGAVLPFAGRRRKEQR